MYVVACAAPLARHVDVLARLAQDAEWDVCIIATPRALAFLDVPALQALTGHPVRSHYKRLGDPDVLPGSDEIVVAPATFNTTNKWWRASRTHSRWAC